MAQPDLFVAPDPFVAFAHELADAARTVIRPYYRAKIAIDNKADDSPVTIADREAERIMRTMITARFPDHGILGEEWGSQGVDRDYVWVLDPIDGTKSFVSGLPLFATLIALCHRGTPILGVVDQVVLDERWVGQPGQPTRMNGAIVTSRPCPTLAEASLFTSGPEYYQVAADAVAFQRLHQRSGLKRYGADAYAFVMVAAGFVDIAVEAGVKPYDVLALVPVIEGAGGKMTGWQGEPVTLATDGRVLAVGDPTVHPAALAALQGN